METNQIRGELPEASNLECCSLLPRSEATMGCDEPRQWGMYGEWELIPVIEAMDFANDMQEKKQEKRLLTTRATRESLTSETVSSLLIDLQPRQAP